MTMLTVPFILAFALALYLLVSSYVRHRLHELPAALPTVDAVGWSLTMGACVTLVLALGGQLFPPLVRLSIESAILLALGVSAAIDLGSRLYLSASPLKIFRHLPVRIVGSGSLAMMRIYALTLFPWRLLLALIILMMAGLAVSESLRGRLVLSPAQSGMLLLLSLGGWMAKTRPRPPQRVPAPVLTLGRREGREVLPLRVANRAGSFGLTPAARHLPRVVVLIITDSAGRHLPSSDGGEASLPEKLRTISGDPDDWFIPRFAVTNASCTDVILPSIFTGAAPHESIDKLHDLPFLFDMAKARGYRTALLTSSTLDWANFDRFFSGACLDEVFSAENSGAPYVNDLTIDDAIVVDRAVDIIERTHEPLFVALYTNALHFPFQADSRFPIPEQLNGRRQRALHIVEKSHAAIFEALRRRGLYDDALILSIGDHGETDGIQTSSQAMWRPESYDECILHPLFMLKTPQSMPADLRRALRNNGDALIALIDIAPTFADLLGVMLTDDRRYEGYSLFGSIPADRLAIATSTNQWRGWPRTAVALVRRHEKLVCNCQELCRYYRIAGDHAVAVRDEAALDRMLREALTNPILADNIADIYRQPEA